LRRKKGDNVNIIMFVLGEIAAVGIIIFGYWIYLEWDFRRFVKATKKYYRDDFIKQCEERGIDYRKYLDDC